MNGYFDNAATSFPRPRACAEEITRYLNEVGGPYGRGFYGRALEVSRTVEAARELLAGRLGIGDAGGLVFTSGATAALNTVLRGLPLSPGDEVLHSSMEHNAVMRPLSRLEREKGIVPRPLPAAADGRIDIARLRGLDLSRVRLAAVCHMSNVNGLVQPLEAIKEALGPIPLLVDAAQSAGHLPIDADAAGVDYLAVTGHKSLGGPPGTGGLYLRDPDSIAPLTDGGTGSRSESLDSPEFAPDKFEAGTPNIAGIFGLGAALNSPLTPAHDRGDFMELIAGLRRLPGIDVLAAETPEHQGELISLIHDRLDPAQLGRLLWENAGIETRVGLHCAPLAHRHLGTFPGGTLRIAPSPVHTAADFEELLRAIGREIA